MPIAFKCTCGRQFKTADENAGRTAACPDCKTKLIVPAAAVAAPAFPPAKAPVLPPPLPEDDPPVPEPAGYNMQSEEVVPVPRRGDYPPSGRPRRDDPYNRDDDGRRRPNYGRDDVRDRIVKRPPPARSGMTGAGALAGVAMMVGAVVWFVVGLSFDIIFFYPPILFIIGLIAFIRGLASGRA